MRFRVAKGGIQRRLHCYVSINAILASYIAIVRSVGHGKLGVDGERGHQKLRASALLHKIGFL